jgi:prepilin-type N-terminal cleavage/methylation domain-containing protein
MDGLTLVEVLVVMAVAAFVGAAMALVMRGCVG